MNFLKEKSNNRLFWLLFGIGILFIVSIEWGCKKDEFNTDPSFKVSFSADTVIFDTVFTTIGTSTRSLVIRNTGNNKVNIASVRLARGKSSPFRINIDGYATEELKDLVIAGKDSAYIFVKVTIDPNQEDQPLIQTDSILFSTNGNLQNVKLVAWGQDAYFHHDEKLTGNITLPVNKPHVIYGSLTAQNGCTLTIPAGAKLYFHKNSDLEIRSGATIQVEGTLESPVTFLNDRIEKDYKDIPGLWDGIWLEKGSINNSFVYAEIRNAKVGIQADSCGIQGDRALILHNCLIDNMTNYGLLSTSSHIIATNCQITNSGTNAVALINGGEYDFRNCTIANFWEFSVRIYPCLSISNYTYDTTMSRVGNDLIKAYFGNCIITGSQKDEIEFLKMDGKAFNFAFDFCSVTWITKTGFKDNFTNCILNDKDLKFIDPRKYNFQLDTLCSAKDAASLNIVNSASQDITHDRKGISRLLDAGPDMGAYERVEKARK